MSTCLPTFNGGRNWQHFWNIVPYFMLFVCLFSWRCNPMWLYFSQPGSGL